MVLTSQQQAFAEGARDRLGADLSHGLMGDLLAGQLTAQVGMDVYRNNMAAAWRHAMATTYPVLEQLVGVDGFKLLVRDYVCVHPSTSGDLNHLGAQLHGFLKGYAPLADYPYLPAVAELEWQLHQSHDAANHVPLTVADLMARGVDDWMAATVKYAPSAAVLRMPHAAGTIWLAHQEGGDMARVSAQRIRQHEWVLVSRPQWRVQVEVLSESECCLLELLRDGATFEAAFERLDEASLSVDFVAFLPRCLAAGVWCMGDDVVLK
ncbi:hypothetical protein DTO96_100083 [Ephemeroptericola cinctiostellae]|uniref:Putative DNA-binding domain-containing protein n=1 Tax=Ephemeroptericola cinctiostellae TaxID=2268024 RepID=A0A345D7P2_9BURK|nr:DNA-binding domain-containing protein [Ephemeroptericola cinctiostellae]AXF84380.1 hypothetical protein DTO96_100083 [Ephemeroptericola cinctiostellae]